MTTSGGGGSRENERSQPRTTDRSPFLPPRDWAQGKEYARTLPERIDEWEKSDGWDPLPEWVRQEALQALGLAPGTEDPLPSLGGAGIYVISMLDRVACDPLNQYCEEVDCFLHWAARWYSRRPREEQLVLPSLESLAPVFDADAPIVRAMWPALAYIRCRLAEDEPVADDGTFFLECFRDRGILNALEWVDEVVRLHLTRGTRPRPPVSDADVEEAQTKVMEALLRSPTKFFGITENGPEGVVSYVRMCIERLAAESVPATVRIVGESGVAEPVKVSRRTVRRLRQQGRIDDSTTLAHALVEADARKQHRGATGRTLGELAGTLGCPESTVRKAVHQLESTHGPAPRERSAYRLDPVWCGRVGEHLQTMKPRQKRRKYEDVALELHVTESALRAAVNELLTLRVAGNPRISVGPLPKFIDQELYDALEVYIMGGAKLPNP